MNKEELERKAVIHSFTAMIVALALSYGTHMILIGLELNHDISKGIAVILFIILWIGLAKYTDTI